MHVGEIDDEPPGTITPQIRDIKQQIHLLRPIAGRHARARPFVDDARQHIGDVLFRIGMTNEEELVFPAKVIL